MRTEVGSKTDKEIQRQRQKGALWERWGREKKGGRKEGSWRTSHGPSFEFSMEFSMVTVGTVTKWWHVVERVPFRGPIQGFHQLLPLFFNSLFL